MAFIFTALPLQITTNCGEVLADSKSAFGSLLDVRVASNGTLQTVDYNGIYRVLDLDTKNVIYSYDMKPDLSLVNTNGANSLDPEDVKFIQLAYIKKDTELLIGAPKYTFRVTLGSAHQIVYNYDSQFSGEKSYLARVYRSSKIEYTVISPDPFSGSMFFSEEPYVSNPYHFYSGSIYVQDPLTDATWHNEIPNFSSGPEKLFKIRMYGVVYPNRIAYRNQNTLSVSSISDISYFDETSSWTNITSNVAEHPNYDLIVYGVNNTKNGGAMFRRANFQEVGELKLYEHYTVNEFVPEQTTVLIYYPQGKICFLNFVISMGFNSNLGSCHPMIALHIRMVFDIAHSRFIAFRESTVAVYDFPTFTLKHTYAESPNYSDMLNNNQYQFHTYTNLYVKKFDTNTGTYVGPAIVTGNVEIAKINPHNDDFLFYKMDGVIKRKKISTGDVDIYDLKEKVNFNSLGLTDFSLKAFDIHKVSTNKIGAFYCGLDESTNPHERVCIQIEYHYDIDEAFYYVMETSDFTWKTLSIGTHSSNPGLDIWVVNGSSYKLILAFDTTGKEPGKQMQIVVEGFQKSNYYYPVYYSNVLQDSIFTAGFEKGAVICYTEDSNYSCKNITSPSWGFTTNCFNKIIDPTGKKDFYCGGSHIVRMSADSDNYYHRTFLVHPNNMITGVVYQEWRGENIYLYQNEGTKTVYNPNGETKCYQSVKNGITEYNFQCKDKTYCTTCDINTGEYCIKCKSGRIAYNGKCVNDCPGFFLGGDGGECFSPHCPYGYYKDGVAESGSCLPNDCSSGEEGRNWVFGDSCTKCEAPMIKNGIYCDCPNGKIRSENNTCIEDGGSSTQCPSPKKYMWHYGMCVDTVRNSTEYTVYGNSGENIYCDHKAGRFVNFSDNKKCIDTCPSTKYKGNHPDYGLICVTSDECSSLNWEVSEINKYCQKKSCLQTEYLNPDTGLCVTTCPIPKYYSPTGYTPKTCLDICPGPSSSPAHTVQTWGIASTQACADLGTCKTVAGMNTYNTTWVCINKTDCNSMGTNVVVKDWSDCRARCPTNSKQTFYLHNSTECLSKKNETNLEVPSVISATLLSYQLSLNIFPYLQGLVLNSDTTNLFTYMAQTFNKLLMFSFFSFFMDREMDRFFLNIFHDLMDDVSEWFINLLEPGFVNDEDMVEVCERQSKRFCHVGVTNNILSSQIGPLAILGLILVSLGSIILLSRIFKNLNKVKLSFLVFTLPNYFIGNQLQLIFTVLNDILVPIWKDKFWIIGYIVSIAFGIFFLGTITYLQFSKKRGYYIDQIIKKNLGEVFASEKISVNYSRVQLSFDVLMSLVLIIPSHYQRIQCGIWLFCETGYCLITMKMRPFTNKKFMGRTNIINILFVVLAISILILIQTQKSHQVTLSIVVTLLSGFILAIDLISSLYIVIVELYEKFKKKKVKSKGKSKSMDKKIKNIRAETRLRGLENTSSRALAKNFDSNDLNQNTINPENAKANILIEEIKKPQFVQRQQYKIKVKRLKGVQKKKPPANRLIEQKLRLKYTDNRNVNPKYTDNKNVNPKHTDNKNNNPKYNSLYLSNKGKINFLKLRKSIKPTVQRQGKNENDNFIPLKSKSKISKFSVDSRLSNSTSSNNNILSRSFLQMIPQANSSRRNQTVEKDFIQNKILSKYSNKTIKCQNAEKAIRASRKNENRHVFEGLNLQHLDNTEEQLSEISRNNISVISLDEEDSTFGQKKPLKNLNRSLMVKRNQRSSIPKINLQTKLLGNLNKVNLQIRGRVSSVGSINNKLKLKSPQKKQTFQISKQQGLQSYSQFGFLERVGIIENKKLKGNNQISQIPPFGGEINHKNQEKPNLIYSSTLNKKDNVYIQIVQQKTSSQNCYSSS